MKNDDAKDTKLMNRRFSTTILIDRGITVLALARAADHIGCELKATADGFKMVPKATAASRASDTPIEEEKWTKKGS